MNLIILLHLLALPRILRRIQNEKGQISQSNKLSKVLVYGVESGSASLVSFIKHNLTGLNIVGFLDDMAEMLEGNPATRLREYRKLYQNLLIEVKHRTPRRVLRRKYQSLKKAVEQQFAP